MTKLAFLPMAALPELQPAKQAFWSALAAQMIRAGVEGVPDGLSLSDDLQGTWRNPDLLFSQTCGYPLVLGLDQYVQLVATPVYTARGCSGANYSSAIVVRHDDDATALAELRGRRCAYNNEDSQSGYNILRWEIAKIAQSATFFADVIETGGHLLSVCAVAEGEADVAAIDCVALASIIEHRPRLASQVRVLSFTAASPTLPFVTSTKTTAEQLQRLRVALGAVFKAPELADTRGALLYESFEVLPRSAYDVMTQMQDEAESFGYPRLA